MYCPNGFLIGEDFCKFQECVDSCGGCSYSFCRKKRHSCVGKADFGSKVIAEREARKQEGYCAYKCEFCGGWHIGRDWSFFRRRGI